MNKKLKLLLHYVVMALIATIIVGFVGPMVPAFYTLPLVNMDVLALVLLAVGLWLGEIVAEKFKL